MAAQTAEKIEIVYDDECPVCKTYCTNISLDNPEDSLTLTDARRKTAIMDDVTAKGWNIDEGIVVKINDKMYYNSEAMHQIAIRTKEKGFMGWVNRVFFRTARLSNVVYPAAKVARNMLLRVMGVGRINNLKSGNTLKKQLGVSWGRLNPNIQARFDREPEEGETITYEGVMREIRRSRMGWLFAQLTRVVGNPLTPFGGKDIPMQVALFKRKGKTGVFWQRTYFFEQRKPYIVTSAKKESAKGEMLECVGAGFGMKLHVYEQDGDLHFKSYRYFWNVVPLPHWLSPGATHVIHKDLGEGNFMFTISMVHPQLGETFFQQGVFHKKG